MQSSQGYRVHPCKLLNMDSLYLTTTSNCKHSARKCIEREIPTPYAIGIGKNAADKESRERPLRSPGLGLVAPRSVSARPSLHAENYTKFPFAFSTRHRPHTLRPRHLLQYVTQAKQQECTQPSLLTKQRDSQISHRDNNEQQHPQKANVRYSKPPRIT